MRKVIYFFVFCFLIFCFIYLGKYDFSKYNKSSINKKNSNSILNIDDSIYKNTNHSKILRLFNKKEDALILMCTSDSKVCLSYAEILNDIAIENKFDKIYYYDVKEDRNVNNATYQKIVDELDNYLYVNDLGKKEINTPVFVYIKDNCIYAFDDSFAFNKEDNPFESSDNTFKLISYFNTVFGGNLTNE